MSDRVSTSATHSVYLQMLDNIQHGQWPVGEAIPSERTLIDQFGVSRIAIREAVSMLRGMGVVDVGHGRRTRVRRVDSAVFGRLLPLMLFSDGQRTFDQVFEVRLAIESRTSFLAATARTAEHLRRLEELVERFRRQSADGDASATETDLEFHLLIAAATGNPLFPLLLEALARFVTFAQTESCRDDPRRSQRAALAHEAIAEALAAGDAERARVEMEAHLRYSATRRIDPAGRSQQSAP